MRQSMALISLVVAGTAAGCGGFSGGGSHGGQSIAPTSSNVSPTGSGSVSLIPSHITRDAKGYSWTTYYQPNQTPGAAIAAASVGPVGTDIFCGVAPLGNIDHIAPGGGQTEVTLVYDVENFAVQGATMYAATGNAIGSDAGQVYARDGVSGQWMLSYDSSQKEAVVLSMGTDVYAFSGENDLGTPLTIAMLSSSTAGGWHEIATINSAVPQCAAVYGNEIWVGGRDSNSVQGSAHLSHGMGTLWSDVAVPFTAFHNQVVGVTAIANINSALYVGVEAVDSVTGNTVGGALYGYDTAKMDLVQIQTFQNDAPSALVGLDGTVYVGFRSGQLAWLDTKGALQGESTLQSNLGVTSLLTESGYLFVGLRTATGAMLVERLPDSGAPTPTPTPAPSTQPTPAPSPTPAGLSFATDMAVYFGASGKCTVCHKAGGAAGQWPLTSYTQVAGGSSTVFTPAAYVVPGQAANSLIATITAQGSGIMVNMAGLTSADSDKIATWITQGAQQ